jgi:hypothetical protein
MTGDNLRDAVFFAIIAGILLLQAMNRRSTKRVFTLNHWEFVLILCCFAVYSVLRFWGRHSDFDAFLSAFVCVIVAVYSYFRQRRVNRRGPNSDDKSKSD